MKLSQACDVKLFFSRQDSTDPRLGELVKCGDLKDLEKNQWAIFGYPDDEGIKLNGGRLGAAQAPHAIRKALYRMTPRLQSSVKPALLDLGDLQIEGADLTSRHQDARDWAQSVFQKKGRWLVFGGGHDYAFSDVGGFLATHAVHGQRPLVINFDAHLDVRSAKQNANSGTAFRRLMEEFNNFDLLEVGIQSQCNSEQHLKWFRDQGGQALMFDQIINGTHSPREHILNFLSPHLAKLRPTFVSVDIDAFASSFAPGCSQSWATGLYPNDIFPIFDFICTHTQIHGVGIYEVSPPLDIDERTSKLAALIAHKFIYSEAPNP